MLLRLSSISLLFATCFVPCAFATDLFSVSATDGVDTVNVSSKSVIDLVNDLVKSQNAFTSLASQNVTASVNYAGIPSAVSIALNDTGTSATLTGLGGLNKTFTGTSAEDLQNQIQNWLKKDGAKDLAAFLAAVNKQSMAAIIDGNPSAQTAVMAAHSFNRWAGTQGENLRLSQAGFYADFGGSYTQYKLDNFKSNLSSADLTLGYRFAESAGLFNTTQLGYQDIEGSKVSRFGDELALPLTFMNNSGIKVDVTPMAMAGGAASVDMANGGLFWAYGAAGHLTWGIGSGFSAGAGVQWIRDNGLPLTLMGYKFDTQLKQTVFSYGIDASYDLGTTFHLIGGVGYHQLLDDAAQASWFAPTAALRWGNTTALEVGYEGTFSEKIKGTGWYARFGWKF